MGLIYGLSFRILTALIFHRVEFQKPDEYSIWRILWKELAHFGLLWEQDTTLSLYHVTQSVVRVGSKIGIIRFEDWEDKELRLEPKFLNRGLFRPLNWFNSSLLLYLTGITIIQGSNIDPLIHWSINPPSPLFDIEIKQWK